MDDRIGASDTARALDAIRRVVASNGVDEAVADEILVLRPEARVSDGDLLVLRPEDALPSEGDALRDTVATLVATELSRPEVVDRIARVAWQIAQSEGRGAHVTDGSEPR